MASDENQQRYFFWLLLLASALLILAPIRKGDLAGYDDALYAHIAKAVVATGDWLNLRSNGGPALEHPPLLVWAEATLFSVFGLSDSIAKLPSALSGLGTVLLVYWLARHLLADELKAAIAMFAMATSLYFLKYAARAMTDVPCTFLFIASIYAWIRTRETQTAGWYLMVGVIGALAQLSRGMIGFGLPLILLFDSIALRRKPRLSYAVASLAVMFLPLAAWYVYTVSINRAIFFGVHSTWLRNEVFGPLDPPWRRYTGAFEYVWMISKSYWPYFPFMIAGIITVVRTRNRQLYILVIWSAVIFALCAVTKSRVLRYMLPAYPAFSILCAIGLCRLFSAHRLRAGLRVASLGLLAAAVYIALFPPVVWHATEICPIAAAETKATPAGERFIFYDKGDPRYDEANQLQWYGDRTMFLVRNARELEARLQDPGSHVAVVDEVTFQRIIQGRFPYQLLAQKGHLVCVRVGRTDGRTESGSQDNLGI